jgi:hypothetical protein
VGVFRFLYALRTPREDTGPLDRQWSSRAAGEHGGGRRAPDQWVGSHVRLLRKLDGLTLNSEDWDLKLTRKSSKKKRDKRKTDH